jgi:hypothetical protein
LHVLDDFNDWAPTAGLLTRGPDGHWPSFAASARHRYMFYVVGEGAGARNAIPTPRLETPNSQQFIVL